MSNIVCFKMLNGLDVIGKKVEDYDKSVWVGTGPVLEDALVFNVARSADGNGVSISFGPVSFVSEQGPVTIQLDAYMYQLPPRAETVEMYERTICPVIMPSSSIIV